MDKLNLNIIIYPFVALASIYGIALNKEKIIYKYLAFILTFLSMIRFDTGYDYYWYYAVSKYQYMYHPRIQGMYKNLEPGIQKIVDFARYYKHPQYFFAITGLITFGFIYYTIYRDSKSPLISLSFFMFLEMGFFRSNEIIMQYCALSICFFSLKYAYEKKYIQYISLILIVAFLFHNSAILCLVFIFIPRFKIKPYLWIIYIGICILFFGKILPVIAQIVVPQYVYLFTFAKHSIYSFKDIKMSFILTILLIILDYKLKIPYFKIKKQSSYIVYQKNIFIIGTILSFILAYLYRGHTPFRIGVYFMVYYLILVGEYSNYFSVKVRKKIKIIIILILNFWIIKGIILDNKLILNKSVGYNEEGKLIRRPNSIGFKLFFNKTELDMHRYLPNQKRGSWK